MPTEGHQRPAAALIKLQLALLKRATHIMHTAEAALNCFCFYACIALAIIALRRACTAAMVLSSLQLQTVRVCVCVCEFLERR